MASDSPWRDGRFPTTRWTLVAQAGGGEGLQRRIALEQLLPRYLPALRTHLVQTRRMRPDEADDLLQEFIAGRVLEKDLVGRADREVGRFRSYLLKALDRFLIDAVRRRSAQKRSPAGGPTSNVDDVADLSAAPRPGDAFDAAWARGLLQQTLQRMQQQCVAEGRKEVWEVFECRLLEPCLRGAAPLEYDELVRRFGFQSPSQAANVLVTAKRMFGRVLRAIIAEYATGEESIESEIRDLRDVLGRGEA